MSENQIPYGYFVDVTRVPEEHFTDQLLESATRLMLRAALADANDIAEEGMRIDLSTVRVFTALPDDLYDEAVHGPKGGHYGIGYYYEAYDPEDDVCVFCAA